MYPLFRRRFGLIDLCLVYNNKTIQKVSGISLKTAAHFLRSCCFKIGSHIFSKLSQALVLGSGAQILPFSTLFYWCNAKNRIKTPKVLVISRRPGPVTFLQQYKNVGWNHRILLVYDVIENTWKMASFNLKFIIRFITK